MKKFFIVISATLLALSCSNHEQLDNTLEQPQVSSDNIRSYEEALQIAEKSISLLEGSSATRSGLSRKIDLKASKIYLQNSMTRSAESNNDTLMYIFNFENNEGFALVAAPRSVEGLLAVTEQGYYEPGVPSGIEGFDMFVEMAENYVNIMSGHSPDGLINIFSRIRYTGNHTPQAGPYIDVAWGQRYPEGEFCPNGVAGCNNTAMAQIMSYFKYPTSINLTYQDRDYDTQYLDWVSMNSHATGHTLTDCPAYSQNTHTMIGRLCRQLGELNHSMYHAATDSTSASTGTYTQTYAASTFATLGYTTSSWDSIPHINIANELDNGHLLLMIGYKAGGPGHAWVLDGYTRAEYYEYMYHSEPGAPLVLDEIFGPLYETLYHLNWGWHGNYNGYFDFNVFNPKDVILPDGDYGLTDLNFSINVRFLPVYR